MKNKSKLTTKHYIKQNWYHVLRNSFHVSTQTQSKDILYSGRWVKLLYTAENNQFTLRWRHQMETFPALLALCAGNSPVTGEFPSQRYVTRNFDVFFDLRPNNGWVNNRKSVDLRRHRTHYDVNVMTQMAIVAHIHNVRNPRWEIWYFHGKYTADTTSYCAYRLTIHYFHSFTDFKYIFTVLTYSIWLRKTGSTMDTWWKNRCIKYELSNLTYWGRDKVDAISQTTTSNEISWMKMYELWLKCHWLLFRRVQLSIFQHSFR